ncbi:uncharacterized [Tachysurus ichikawai]
MRVSFPRVQARTPTRSHGLEKSARSGKPKSNGMVEEEDVSGAAGLGVAPVCDVRRDHTAFPAACILQTRWIGNLQPR